MDYRVRRPLGSESVLHYTSLLLLNPAKTHVWPMSICQSTSIMKNQQECATWLLQKLVSEPWVQSVLSQICVPKVKNEPQEFYHSSLYSIIKVINKWKLFEVQGSFICHSTTWVVAPSCHSNNNFLWWRISWGFSQPEDSCSQTLYLLGYNSYQTFLCFFFGLSALFDMGSF